MRLPFSLLVLTALAPLSLAHAQATTPSKKAPAASKKAPTKAQLQHDKLEKQVDYLWKKSDEAFHDGDYPLSIRYHRQIVKLDPTVIDSYTNAAWLLWSLGKGDEARTLLQVGLKANAKDPEMWDGAAQQYELQKRPADAYQAYAKAVALTKPKADLMLRRRYAHAAARAGNLSKSAEVWRGLVADFPNDFVNKRNLAEVEQQMSGGAPENGAPPKTTAVALILKPNPSRLRSGCCADDRVLKDTVISNQQRLFGLILKQTGAKTALALIYVPRWCRRPNGTLDL